MSCCAIGPRVRESNGMRSSSHADGCVLLLDAGVEPPESTKAVRLICMGRGMLKDGQSLEQSSVPAFSTHPTPVNVSVLRKSATVATDAVKGAVKTAPKPVATAGCGCRIM